MEEGSKLGTPGHSLALRYEVELQQVGGGAPTLSRVNKCFQILDEVIPQLGVFQRVMQLVKQELYVAVYSSDCTSKSASPQHHQEKQHLHSKMGNSIAPMPYFVLAQRLGQRKASEHNKLKVEISSLKEQLYTCEADLEKALSSVESYRHDLKDREAKIHHLMAEFRTRCAENEHLQEIVSHNQLAKDRLCQELDFRMFSLRNTIANLKEENGRLRNYKVTHDQLQETQLLTKQDAMDHQLANSKNEMEQHSTTTNKLKIQLHTLQNSLMDELDSWLKSCYDVDSQTSPAEVLHKKKTFKSKISNLSTELALLDTHGQVLNERLSQLGRGSSSPHTALVLPLHPLNPLIPQEQIASKYAAMLSASSDGGINFYPLKVAQHCTSCAQKTVLCPHKVCEEDLVIQLPVNSTHLKICRPSFQLTKPKLENSHPVKPAVDKVVATTQGLHAEVPDFGYLWTQFSRKFPKFNQAVLRKLSLEQLLDLIEQFYATLLLQDDKAVLAVVDEDKPLTLYELLLEFLRDHYFMRHLTPISYHAFISSLEEYYLNDKELLMVGHALCGDLDGCSLRYNLLQASLVQTVPQWASHSHFSTFITCLYPFLGEEEIEQMCLNYVAHSDNRLSAQLVLDFLQVLILSHKDPLVVMLEAQLTDQPGSVVGSMLEAEFAEAMEKVVPESSDLLSHRLFLQSLALFHEKSDSGRQSLPVRNLAYIAAYQYRLCVQNEVVVKLQALNAGTMDSPKHQPQPKGTSKGHKYKVHTMDTARKLAERIKALKAPRDIEKPHIPTPLD